MIKLDLFGRSSSDVFDKFWGDVQKDFNYYLPQTWVTTTSYNVPSYSFNFKRENDGAIQVYTQDMPGVKKEDLILEVLEENILRISYERDGKKYAYDVTPSKGYDVETADAKLELGVLEVRFTKREVASKKKIVVK
jgi:HSP20 family molecular chaperone IbpA